MTIQPSLDLTPYLLESGDVQSYAWPGGYPIYFITQGCEAVCPSCVNKNRDLIDAAYADEDARWNVIDVDINYEDTYLYCCNCDATIEAAYAD